MDDDVDEDDEDEEEDVVTFPSPLFERSVFDALLRECKEEGSWCE